MPWFVTLVTVSISSYWARLFISAIGKAIYSSHLTCLWWSYCFCSHSFWSAYHIYHVPLDHAIEWGKRALVLLQDWSWMWGRVCLNWCLGTSTGPSQSEWQKGEAEPRMQKQGAEHRSWEVQLPCWTEAQGKSHALGRKGTEVASKLHHWTWCELGSQAWAGAMATWLGWRIMVSVLASLCVWGRAYIGQTVSESPS